MKLLPKFQGSRTHRTSREARQFAFTAHTETTQAAGHDGSEAGMRPCISNCNGVPGTRGLGDSGTGGLGGSGAQPSPEVQISKLGGVMVFCAVDTGSSYAANVRRRRRATLISMNSGG